MTGKSEPRPFGQPYGAPVVAEVKPRPSQGAATHVAPSGKPSGSMIYTVQKGANIIPSWRKG